MKPIRVPGSSHPVSRTVLIVEDEPDVRMLLRMQLEGWGYRVIAVEDAERAWAVLTADRSGVDLVIIDIMLPGMWDGNDLLRAIREHPNLQALPVLMLTARGMEHDVVRSFRLGADDYVIKPYRTRELRARIEALLRRARPVVFETTGKHRWQDLEWDPERRQVTLRGRPLALTPVEYEVFALLAGHPGRVFDRQAIHARLTLNGRVQTENVRVIDVHIRHIRQKLGPYAHWLVTIRGWGYTWRPQTERSQSTE